MLNQNYSLIMGTTLYCRLLRSMLEQATAKAYFKNTQKPNVQNKILLFCYSMLFHYVVFSCYHFLVDATVRIVSRNVPATRGSCQSASLDARVSDVLPHELSLLIVLLFHGQTTFVWANINKLVM